MRKKSYIIFILLIILLFGCNKNNITETGKSPSSDEITQEKEEANPVTEEESTPTIETGKSPSSDEITQEKEENHPGHISSEYNLSSSEFSNLFLYEIVDNNITITKYIGNSSDVRIPNTVDNKYIVHSIKTNSFTNTKIENVLLPSSLINLESDAFFNCPYLKIVIFDDGDTYNDLSNQKNNTRRETRNSMEEIASCTNVEEKTFHDCPKLELVTISENIESMDSNFYYGCDVITFDSKNNGGYYVVKDGILYSNFGTELFRNPSGNPNEEIVVLEGVNSIKDMAFFGCNKIKTIVLPKSIKTIEAGAFSNCPLLEKIEFADGCELSELGDFVFASCPNLKELKLPSIETIPYQSFQDSSLESIIIPASVKIIENSAFSSCEKLKNVIFEDESNLEKIGAQAFCQCESLETIIFPDKLIEIDDSAFYNCTNLEYITIPKSVKKINMAAFCMSGLKEIIFEEESQLEYIGDSAFWGCSLTQITIPASVKSVGDYAFTALEVLNLSNADLSKNDFNDEVNIRNSIDEIVKYDITDDGFVFLNEDNDPKLIRYMGQDKNIVLPDYYKGLEYTIGKQVFFFSNQKIKSIYISKGVKEIISSSLYDLRDLEEIVVDKENKYYDSRLNSNCIIETTTNVLIKGCKSSFIPNNIQAIGDYAFCNIDGIKNVFIPKSVERIGLQAFDQCSMLSSVIFEEDSNCSFFDDHAFGNCPLLEEFIIPDKVTSLKSTFVNCYSLKEIHLSKNIELFDSPFSGCTSLEVVTIDPDSLYFKVDGNCVIRKDNNILVFGYGDINIPNYVKRIDDFAFPSTTLPLVVNIPASVEEIGYNAFGGSNVAIITFDKDSSLRKIESYAFSSQNLVSLTIPENIEIIEENGLYTSEKIIEIINLSKFTENELSKYYPSYYYGPQIITNGDSKIELIDNKYFMYDNGYNYYLVACSSVDEDVLRLPEKINDREYYVYKCGIQYYNVRSLIIPNGIGLDQFSFTNSNIKNIYCEVYSQPSDWAFSWNFSIESANIYWSNQWKLIDGKPTIFTSVINEEESISDFNIAVKDQIVNYNTATFKLECDDNVEITNISLIYDDKYFMNTDFNNDEKSFIFEYLFSGKEYYVEIKYEYKINIFGYELTQIKYEYIKFETPSLAVPNLEISNQKLDKEEVSFELIITDVDNILTINKISLITNEEIYEILYDESITSYSLNISAKNLVEVVIIYEYDLNDGTGVNYSSYNIAIENEDVVEEQEGTEGLLYKLSEDGLSYIVVGYEGQENDVVIPEMYNDLPVTSIGNGAFSDCSNLTSITIPNSVTTIEDFAFDNCTELQKITIPYSVISIGSWAFSRCLKLNIIFEENSQLTSIGKYAFQGCLTTKIILPNSLKSIGDYSFGNCQNLSSIIIPDSVTSIGKFAFENCSNLENIILPDSVTSIGTNAFYLCASLKSAALGNCLTSIAGSAFSGCSSLTSITIPASVTSIGSCAFNNCSSLINIIIPKGITSIDDHTFSGCSSLENIILPDSVTSIGIMVFSGCSSLTSITIPASVTSIGSCAFNNCSSLINVYYTGTEEEWKKITKDSNNSNLILATITYNYKEE